MQNNRKTESNRGDKRMTFIQNLTWAQLVGAFDFLVYSVLFALLMDLLVDIYKMIYIIYKGVIGWVK